MLPHRLRRPLVWSPIVAVAAQLLLAAVTAASTGGGDFPRIRVLLTFREPRRYDGPARPPALQAGPAE